MKQTKINIKALKFICVVLPLIYLIMISVTMMLYFRIEDNMYDLSSFEPKIEYFNIHTSGGYSTHDIDLTAYTDDGRYYLEFNNNLSDKPDDHVKYELSKTEYLLCTNIDIQTLEEYPGDWGNDIPEETLTIKEKGKEEIVIDKKMYSNYSDQNFGLCRQIYDMKKKAPEGKVSYDTYIKLASYLYSNEANFALLRYGGSIFEYDDPTFKEVCINKKYVRIPKKLKELYSDSNCLIKEPKTEKGAKHKEEVLKKFIQTDYLGSKAYYSEVISENDGSLGFVLASPKSGYIILFYGDIPKETEPQQYLDDVRSIIEGDPAGKTAVTIALSAETALFVAVMFFAVKRTRRKMPYIPDISSDDSGE